MFPVLIDKLQRRVDLTVDEAAAAMGTIMDGQAQPSQMAGFLVGLAMKGTLRFLFLLWAFVVFVLLVKGYIFSRYTFQPNEFRIAAFLIVASLLSVFGAWFGLRTGARPKLLCTSLQSRQRTLRISGGTARPWAREILRTGFP